MTLPTPFSYTQFDGDGLETSFSFTWDYISKEDVKVYLDKTLVSEGTASNEWQWDGDKKIKMGTAPAVGTKLTIRRETPEDKQIVQWTDGSHLIADDLNKSDRQWLYLAEEHHDVIIRIIWGLPPVPGPGLPDDLFGLWNRLARNKDSNKGTSDEVAQTIDKTDQLKGDAVPGSVQNGEDSYVLTLGAVSERLDLIKGDGSSYPGTGNTGQLGKLRVNSSNKLFYWDQSLATPAWVEIVGGQGTPGQAATVDVGTTTTLAPGSSATVTNSGTSSAAVFDFGIPKGEKGDKGEPGKDGTGAGTVTEVKGGPGIVSDGSTSTPKVSVDLATNPGLELTGSGDAQKLKVKVKSGGGITLDADGLSSSAGGGFVKLDDGGTTQRIISTGLELGSGTDAANLGWKFEYLSGSRPQSWFKSQASAGAHDVRVGDDINAGSPWIGGGAKGHGIDLKSGDVSSGSELNPPRLTIQSSTKDSNTDVAFLVNGGHNSGTVKEAIKFNFDGSAVFQGEIETNNQEGFVFEHSGSKLRLQSQNLSANYVIRFPPSGPLSAGGQVLRTTTTNSGQDLAWVSVRDDSANDGRYLINSNAPAATGQGGGDAMIGQLTLGAAALTSGSSIVATARAVPNNTAWSLGATNVWTIPANATVLFPLDTNLNIGPPENQCGIFVLQGDGISWTDTDANRGWRFPGGNVIGGTAGQRTIVPFIVTAQNGLTDVVINLGNPTVCEAQ